MMVCGTRRFQRRGHWGEFGMMGMRARFFGPGEVRLALLSLIADGPKHGYELMRQLEERSGGIYSASAGTVYPTLQQLEDEGLISSDSKEGKRVYAITDAGAAELKREDETVRRIWWRAKRWAGWRHANDPIVFVLLSAQVSVPTAALIADPKPSPYLSEPLDVRSTNWPG